MSCVSDCGRPVLLDGKLNRVGVESFKGKVQRDLIWLVRPLPFELRLGREAQNPLHGLSENSVSG